MGAIVRQFTPFGKANTCTFGKYITIDLHTNSPKVWSFLWTIMGKMNIPLPISVFLSTVLGWLAGLFINYVSDVLPFTRHFSPPACTACQAPFSWKDYLTFRSCQHCGKRRGLRTWLVQILTVAAFIYIWQFPSKQLGVFLGMIVFIYFAIITVIDLEHRLILHSTSLVGAVLGLIVGTYINSRINDQGILIGLGKSLLGGLIGFGVMFLLYQLGTLVARYRARKLQNAGQADDEEEALGGGDVYLAGVLGLMVGLDFVGFALAWGIILGGLVSILFILSLLLRRRYSNAAMMTFIPYGPYFIISAAYLLFL
jgi:prepilin signal peptidase PulO-like enzyme (type II secretory pathway)